jgi:hypothetical protein
MSVRNGLALLLALSALLFLAACGNSNSGITPPVAPPSGNFTNANLKGTYVFSVSGTDENTGGSYAIVGAIAADGSGGNGRGNITGGTIDIVDPSLNTPAFNLNISGNGFYSVGVDGRGTFTIGTTTANPFTADMTFDFVLEDSSHGLIIQFDNNASGSGTLDLQTTGLTQSSLTGSYAFSFSGADGSGAFATIGDFTFGANGAISGLEDFNSGGIPYPNEALSGQVILGPQSAPTTELVTAAGPNPGGALFFDTYAIDATHLKLIESDSFGTLVGDAYSQPSTAFPTAAPLAFTLEGFLSSNVPFASGGYMVPDTLGDILDSSTQDVNAGGTTSSAPVQFSANYASGGSGRFTIDNFNGFVGANSDSLYAAYTYSGGLFLLEIDENLGVTTGAAYPQSTSSFGATSQGYGLNLTGINTTNSVEIDDIAEFTNSVASSGAGTLPTGIIDENVSPGGSSFGAPYPGLALTNGVYGSLDALGRYGLFADAGTSAVSTLNGGFNLNFYTVDGTTFPFVELDPGQVATGVFVLQNPTASASAATSRSHMFVLPPLTRPHAKQKKTK